MTERDDPGCEAPIADILSVVPFFAPLPDESCACFDLLRRGRLEQHATGARLLAAGARPDLIFLLSGRARVGGARPWTLQAGQHVGEIDLLLGRPSSADVETVTPTEAFRVTGELWPQVLSCCGLIAARLLRDFARRIDRLPSPYPA